MFEIVIQEGNLSFRNKIDFAQKINSILGFDFFPKSKVFRFIFQEIMKEVVFYGS